MRRQTLGRHKLDSSQNCQCERQLQTIRDLCEVRQMQHVVQAWWHRQCANFCFVQSTRATNFPHDHFEEWLAQHSVEGNVIIAWAALLQTLGLYHALATEARNCSRQNTLQRHPR
ncbi:unnamed protein product [Ixodes pacificus]